MASFPIPPNYSSAREALSRARDNGEPATAFERLRGLLIFKKLKALAVDHRGKIKECSSEFWEDEDNDHFLGEPDERRVETRDHNLRIVFLTSDLDEILPTLLQQIERESASVVPTTAKETDSTSPTNEASEWPKKIKNLELSQELATPEPNSAGPRRKRGRPTNPNIDDFWIEAARLVNEGDQGSPGQK